MFKSLYNLSKDPKFHDELKERLLKLSEGSNSVANQSIEEVDPFDIIGSQRNDSSMEMMAQEIRS